MQGGDGLFNEILNGLLLCRHKVFCPLWPTGPRHSTENGSSLSVHEADGNIEEHSDHCEYHSPLLMSVDPNVTQVTNLRELIVIKITFKVLFISIIMTVKVSYINISGVAGYE